MRHNKTKLNKAKHISKHVKQINQIKSATRTQEKSKLRKSHEERLTLLIEHNLIDI